MAYIIEEMDIPVMVPGNFPVYSPVMVQDVEKMDPTEEIRIMNNELKEIEYEEYHHDQTEDDWLLSLQEFRDCKENDLTYPGNETNIPEEDPDHKKALDKQVYDSVIFEDLPGCFDILFPENQDPEIIKPFEGKIFSMVIPGDKYKELFGSIGIIAPETVLHITNEGIRTSMVDTANVALVSVDYKPENFEKYELVESFDMGIDLKSITGLKTMIKKGSIVLFEVERSGENYWYTITIDGTETRVKALDPLTIRKEPKEPVIELKQRIEFMAGSFMDGIKEGAKISDKVYLTMDNGAFTMLFEGNESKQNRNIPVDSFNQGVPKVRSLFSLEYVKDMAKVMNKKENVVLYMGDDHPFKMVRETDITNITFMLAPRIEAD
jgi:proliferating cell nuclear antigen